MVVLGKNGVWFWVMTNGRVMRGENTRIFRNECNGEALGEEIRTGEDDT